MLVYDLKIAKNLLTAKIGIADDDLKAEEKSFGCFTKVVEIKNCRCPTIHCLKSSMIKVKNNSSNSQELVHMNKMKDYYKNNIYISQAPIKAEFAKYWDVIVQEKV